MSRWPVLTPRIRTIAGTALAVAWSWIVALPIFTVVALITPMRADNSSEDIQSNAIALGVSALVSGWVGAAIQTRFGKTRRPHHWLLAGFFALPLIWFKLFYYVPQPWPVIVLPLITYVLGAGAHWHFDKAKKGSSKNP